MARSQCGLTEAVGLSGQRSDSAMSRRSDGWHNGWPRAPTDGWTRRLRMWMPGCRTAHGFTPSCHRWHRGDLHLPANPAPECVRPARSRRCWCNSTSGRAWLAAALVESRAAFLVSGGTGSGKTTLLSALLSIAPPSERILIVEDSGELDPDHEHVVRLESSTAQR